MLGPLVTIAVALEGQSQLRERFDEVRERARHESLARELKFGVTDVNGWQTAHGYDSGASRPRFERSVAAFRADLREAGQVLTDPAERRLVSELNDGFDRFMNVDVIASASCATGARRPSAGCFSVPRSRTSRQSRPLARYEDRRATATERAFGDARDSARKRLIAVALGARLVIVLLLVTAWDVARLALEGAKDRDPARAGR